jgi:hypothetical protein
VPPSGPAQWSVAGQPSSQPFQPLAGAPYVPPHRGTAQFDIKRLLPPDFIVAGGAFLLMISLFLSWYTVGTGYLGLVSLSAVSYHGWMYLVFFLTLATIVYLALKTFLVFDIGIPHGVLLIIASAVSFFLTLLAFLLVPVGWSWSFGAYLGLICGLAMLGGAIWRQVLERSTSPGALGAETPHTQAAQTTGPFPSTTSPTGPQRTVSTPAPAAPASPPSPPTAAPGSPIAAAADPATGTGSCPVCGAANPVKNRFCNACGAALETS